MQLWTHVLYVQCGATALKQTGTRLCLSGFVMIKVYQKIKIFEI